MSFFSMTKIALAGFFRKPETIALSKLSGHVRSRTRGHVEIEIGDCIYCGFCARRCPTHAIEVAKAANMADAKSTWTIDRFRCIQCGGCVEVCPKKCLCMETAQTPPAFEKHKETFESA